jgi:hypothetical protein
MTDGRSGGRHRCYLDSANLLLQLLSIQHNEEGMERNFPKYSLVCLKIWARVGILQFAGVGKPTCKRYKNFLKFL